MVLTVVVAAAPSLFLLTFFYLKDRYEREPLRHILMAFGLGLYAMIAAQGMASTVEGWLPTVWLRTGGEPAKLCDALLLSGLVEELAKWVVLMTGVYHWDEFDEPIDGVVYGVAVALGFATLENLLYVTRLGLASAGSGGCSRFPRTRSSARRWVTTRGGRSSIAGGRSGAIDCSVSGPAPFHGGYNYALHHGLGARVWILISLASAALWASSCAACTARSASRPSERPLIGF